MILSIVMGLNNRMCVCVCVCASNMEQSNTYRWIVLLILLRSKSRGRIRLLANDINVKLEIVSNYFDNPEDVKTMIDGY